MIDQETLVERVIALNKAQPFVQSICKAYPPEAYRIISGPTAIFSVPAGTTMTPAEQVVSMTMAVADWLLEEQ